MNIRLTHVDGSLPNLALMKLSAWHKSQKDNVYLMYSVEPQLFEPKYEVVYASSIFTASAAKLSLMKACWPTSIIGGTGTNTTITVEQQIRTDYEHYDYSIYPKFIWSLGFTSRGCRMSCKFCVVPQKEGKPCSINTICDIWRPETERNIILLDNDFFGQPYEQWQTCINELRDGKFKVCFNQGINARLLNDESAEALASVHYYDDQFKTRRLYTAWDNIGDETIFFKGIDILEKHGIPPQHLMVYMLIGYDPKETWDTIFYRFNRMVEHGLRPYPMAYNGKDKMLRKFQRWVIRRYYEIVPWNEFA